MMGLNRVFSDEPIAFTHSVGLRALTGWVRSAHFAFDASSGWVRSAHFAFVVPPGWVRSARFAFVVCCSASDRRPFLRSLAHSERYRTAPASS